MNYCYVKDGLILDGPRGLYKSWKNISGLNLMNDAQLLTVGWMPVEEVVPPHDSATQYTEGYGTEIKADKVVLTHKIKEYTADQLADKADYDSKQYQRDRQPEYPPMEDYLDGIVKGDQAQIDKYVSDCLAVKQRFPK